MRALLHAFCFVSLGTFSFSFTLKVFVLRHGQTNANAKGVIQGSSDFSRLTDLGKQQATEALQAFQQENIKITSIYSSPLNRVRATLNGLRRKDEAASTGILPPTDTVLENLREIDFYDWEGLDKEALQAKYPVSWRAWKAGNADELIVFDTKKGAYLTERFPLLELWERADLVWDEIFLREQESSIGNTDRAALIVAHGSLGQALLGVAMGWDANQFRVHTFQNCGMVELEFNSDHMRRPKTADRWRWMWPMEKKSAEWTYADSLLTGVCQD
jgi:probable phosphoglycerate mutase